MAKRPTSPSQPSEPAKLVTAREEARGQLLSRHAIGVDLHAQQIGTLDAYNAAREEYQRWTAYNVELLRRMFSTEEYALSFRSAGRLAYVSMGDRSLPSKINDYKTELRAKLNNLMSLAERLDLISEVPDIPKSVATLAKPEKIAAVNNKVFLVHGQDEEAKAIVARFIEHCELQPIILHEQPDKGRTIIEKFEQEADVNFAVVLLTPDDVGCLRSSQGTVAGDQLKPRARQNVVLELGYFLGKLTRSRVCALRKGDVELPSDFSGVVYTPLGPDEGWKVKLAKELRAAGYDVDMNKALG